MTQTRLCVFAVLLRYRSDALPLIAAMFAVTFLLAGVIMALEDAVFLDQLPHIVAVGPAGTCAAPATTYIVWPAYFSSLFNVPTQLDIFGDGATITVNNAPTVVIIRTTVTSTISNTRTASIENNSHAQVATSIKSTLLSLLYLYSARMPCPVHRLLA